MRTTAIVALAGAILACGGETVDPQDDPNDVGETDAADPGATEPDTDEPDVEGTPDDGGDPCDEVDCDDGDPCTTDTCTAGACGHEADLAACPPCASAADCFEGQVCHEGGCQPRCAPLVWFCVDDVTVSKCGADGVPEFELECAFGSPCAGGGCAWGPVAGALDSTTMTVELTVFEEGEYHPVEGAFVMVGDDPDTALTGLTDGDGSVTLSGVEPGVAADVTAWAPGYVASTFAAMQGEIVRIQLDPLPSGFGSSTAPAAMLQGEVTGLGGLTPGVNGEVGIHCRTTDADGLQLPAWGAWTGPDGSFDITTRFGPQAVVCVAGVLGDTLPASCQSLGPCGVEGMCKDGLCRRFSNRRMGAVTGLVPLSGETIDGIEVHMDTFGWRPIRTRLSSYDYNVASGPNLGFAVALLDFGFDGVLRLETAVTGYLEAETVAPGGLPLNPGPSLDGASLGMFAGLLTSSGENQRPMSTRVLRGAALPDNGVLGLDAGTGDATTSEPSTVAFESIWADNSGAVWAVGPGGAAVWDQGWSEVPVAATDRMVVIAGKEDEVFLGQGGEVWAAAAAGKVFELVGGELVLEHDLKSELSALWVAPKGDVFAAGESAFRRAGGAWSETPGPFEVSDLHGTATDDAWAISSLAWTASHWDGEAWMQVSLGKGARAIHALSDEEVVVVGMGGAIWRWTGGSAFDSSESPTTSTLLAVGDDASDTLWAAGEGGTLVRRAGPDSWAVVDSGLGDRDLIDVTARDGLIVAAAPRLLVAPILTGVELLTPGPAGSFDGQLAWLPDTAAQTGRRRVAIHAKDLYTTPLWFVNAGSNTDSVTLPDLECVAGAPALPADLELVYRRWAWGAPPLQDPEFTWTAFSGSDQSLYAADLDVSSQPKGPCCTEDADCEAAEAPCEDSRCIDLRCRVNPVLSPECCQPGDVLLEDFDGALIGYTFEASDSTVGWQTVEPGALAGYSLWYGDPATGDYDTGKANSGTVTTPAFELPDGSPVASFWARLDVEPGAAYDQLQLRLLAAGVEPEVVWAKSEVAPLQWQRFEVDLSAWAGQEIQLQWSFDTVDESANDKGGVYIDELAITIACLGAACGDTDACEDSDACTIDSCDPNDGCVAEPLDCDDGDPCTNDVCLPSVGCAGLAVAGCE